VLLPVGSVRPECRPLAGTLAVHVWKTNEKHQNETRAIICPTLSHTSGASLLLCVCVCVCVCKHVHMLAVCSYRSLPRFLSWAFMSFPPICHSSAQTRTHIHTHAHTHTHTHTRVGSQRCVLEPSAGNTLTAHTHTLSLSLSLDWGSSWLCCSSGS